MNQLHKKGIMTKEAIELILGVIIVVTLIIMLAKFLVPTYDLKEETAQGYFSQLEQALSDADSQGNGEMSFLVSQDTQYTYYLVSFQEKILYKDIFVSTNIRPQNVQSPYALEINTFADFFDTTGSTHDVCICYLVNDPVEFDRKAVSFSENTADDSLSESSIYSDISRPISSEEMSQARANGASKGVVRVHRRYETMCEPCYHVGEDVLVVHESTNTVVDGIDSIVRLSSTSSINVEEEGGQYIFTVYGQ